ncbi:MAG: 23S rRNA (uracil-5-)-methyltransferase RumA, partial [Acidobacteria bacterium]
GEGGEIVAVERDAGAVRTGRGLARRAPRPRVRFIAGDVGRTLERLLAGGERFDAVVANPPRAGLDRDVPARLARLAPGRLVLVSCHPATLARDLARLAEQGFRAQAVAAVDMFPQTAHLELVARLAPPGEER